MLLFVFDLLGGWVGGGGCILSSICRMHLTRLICFSCVSLPNMCGFPLFSIVNSDTLFSETGVHRSCPFNGARRAGCGNSLNVPCEDRWVGL